MHFHAKIVFNTFHKTVSVCNICIFDQRQYFYSTIFNIQYTHCKLTITETKFKRTIPESIFIHIYFWGQKKLTQSEGVLEQG